MSSSGKERTAGRIKPVACQGTEGAYSQIAASRLFPDGSFLYFKNFRAVARAVSEGMCRYGVLPIENNTYGSVKDVYRVIGEEQVRIVRGYTLEIDHCLLAKPGTKPEDVRSVCSHEQALGQCSEFLHELGDKVRVVPSMNTAVAARTVAESQDPGAAAISSKECAELYGLQVIRRHIADTDHNYTRFICVAKEQEELGDASRISLMIAIPHRAGSLSAVLKLFADRGINLLKIESAPLPGRDFEFLFYIDIEASCRDPKTREILRELEDMCPMYRFLGNYTEETD